MKTSSQLELREGALVKPEPVCLGLRQVGMWVEIGRLLSQFKQELLACLSCSDANLHGFEKSHARLESLVATIQVRLALVVKYDIEMKDVQNGERFVFFGNHPWVTSYFPFFKVLSDNVCSNLVSVVKEEVVSNVLTRFFIGELLEMAGKVLPINRSNGAKAREVINKRVTEVLTADTGLILFADGRRPYKDRIAAERERAIIRYPDVDFSWLTETCLPRPGGLWSILRAIREGEVDEARFVEFTILEPRRIGYGDNVLVELRDCDLSPCESENDLRSLLLELWKGKNKKIREFRGEGR